MSDLSKELQKFLDKEDAGTEEVDIVIKTIYDNQEDECYICDVVDYLIRIKKFDLVDYVLEKCKDPLENTDLVGNLYDNYVIEGNIELCEYLREKFSSEFMDTDYTADYVDLVNNLLFLHLDVTKSEEWMAIKFHDKIDWDYVATQHIRIKNFLLKKQRI